MARIAFAGVLSLILVGACGDEDPESIPDSGLIDAAIDAPVDAAPDAAPVADLSCIGDPAPTTADDPIIIAGNTFNLGLGGATPIANVTVDVLSSADPTGMAIATGTSDMNGEAPVSVDTAGVPVDVFIRATPPDTYLTTETFFPEPLVANIPGPAVLFDGGTLNLLAGAAGQTQDQTNNGFAVVAVLDCSQMPIYNATVTAPSGTIVYAGTNGTPDTSLTATSTIGLAFVFNVEPGEGLIYDADVDGMSLIDNSARAVAGQVASIGLAP